LRGSRPTVGVARVPQGIGGYGGDGGADLRGPGTRDRRTGCEARKAGAQAPSVDARARLGSGLGPWLQARVGRLGFGFWRAARGHRNPRRGDADGSGGPGPDRTCEAGPPREDPGFWLPWGGRHLRESGVSVVSDARRARPLRRSSRGVREPFVPPGQRPIARSPLAPLHFWGIFIWREARWCRRPPREDRRHPIGTSEPDVPPGQHGAKARRLRFPDQICVTRPYPPANRILGILVFQAISIG
jgi:hypothetical protein